MVKKKTVLINVSIINRIYEIKNIYSCCIFEKYSYLCLIVLQF